MSRERNARRLWGSDQGFEGENMTGTSIPASRNLNAIKRTAVAAGVLAIVAPAAWAQAVLEEVVVTAERRAASIQDTPVSVVAFSGREIEEFGVTNLKDLQNFVPGLSIGGFSDGDTEPDWYIRGVGGGDARTQTGRASGRGTAAGP